MHRPVHRRRRPTRRPLPRDQARRRPRPGRTRRRSPTREFHQTCIDVLCAFLRLPYDPDPGDTPAEGQDPTEHSRARANYRALREVRHTAIRIIANHLRDHATVSWQGHDLDFIDAVFTTNHVSFHLARFVGGTVNFDRAEFRSGTVHFTEASGRRPQGLPDGMADHLS